MTTRGTAKQIGRAGVIATTTTTTTATKTPAPVMAMATTCACAMSGVDAVAGNGMAARTVAVRRSLTLP